MDRLDVADNGRSSTVPSTLEAVIRVVQTDEIFHILRRMCAFGKFNKIYSNCSSRPCYPQTDLFSPIDPSQFMMNQENFKKRAVACDHFKSIPCLKGSVSSIIPCTCRLLWFAFVCRHFHGP